MKLRHLAVVLPLAVVTLSCTEPGAVGPAPDRAPVQLQVPGLPLMVVQFDPARTTGAVLAQRVMNIGAGARALSRLPFVGVQATPAQLSAIGQMPGVVRVTSNRQLRTLSRGSSMAAVAAVLDQSVATIKADQARAEFGVSGSGIGVVILDSGVDGLYNMDVAYPSRTVQNLKVLANQADVMCIAGVPCAPSIYVEGLAVSETSVGHGTHVAGIVGGNGSHSGGLYAGVAPQANLIGIGAGDILFVFWTLAGFDWIMQNHEQYNIKVVNNSWGSSGAFDPNDPINIATKQLHDRGITVVFAAGNDGPGDNTLNPYSVAPWVIGVAASCSSADLVAQEEDCSGNMLADFSSRGIPGDPLYQPTVTAPGVRVVSTRASTGFVLNGLDFPSDIGAMGACGLRVEYVAHYTCASGTSMATPHVAGVVALMQERAGGGLTPDQVRDLLVNTAVSLPEYQPHQVGAGLVDALEAVRGSL